MATYRIHANVNGDYQPLGTVALKGGKVVATPEDGQEQEFDSFLAILRTQGIGPELSEEEFFDTLPDRVNPYFGAVEKIEKL